MNGAMTEDNRIFTNVVKCVSGDTGSIRPVDVSRLFEILKDIGYAEKAGQLFEWLLASDLQPRTLERLREQREVLLNPQEELSL